MILVAQILLAAVFAFSGITKLLDRPGTRDAAAALGVPVPMAPFVAIVLPQVELLLAVGVVIPAAATIASAAIMLLLMAMTARVLLIIRRRVIVACHCFGSFSRQPINIRTVVRNVILITIAGIVGVTYALTDQPYAWWPIQVLIALGIVAAFAAVVAFIIEALIIKKLMEKHGHLLLRLEKLELRIPLGAPESSGGKIVEHQSPCEIRPKDKLPELALHDAAGNLTDLHRVISTARTTLIVMVNPGCGACKELEPDLNSWDRGLLPGMDLVVLTPESTHAPAPYPGSYSFDPLARHPLSLLMTPSAVLVATDGSVASSVAEGPAAVRQLAVSLLPDYLRLA